MSFDVVIRNGHVVDGRAAPATREDVGVRNGMVEAIGDLSAADAARSIDAAGLTVAPGFVDTHTHSEGDLLVHPDRTQPETAGDLDALMGALDAAKASGLDCTFDIYPYPTGSSFPVAYLPPGAQEGGPDAILARLADPLERARLAHFLDNEHEKRGGGIPLGRFVFSYLPGHPELEGMALREIASERHVSLGTALCDLLLAENLKVGFCLSVPVSVARWKQVSRDSMKLLGRPDYMVCSDITPLGAMPQPRSYGAFPRFLGRLRRAFGGLTLEQMVHRSTDVPARRFGLKRRGRLAPGYWADVVVFDADHLMDNATYDDPRQFPTGIPYVLVNGQIAVDNERVTGVLAGQAVPD